MIELLLSVFYEKKPVILLRKKGFGGGYIELSLQGFYYTAKTSSNNPFFSGYLKEDARKILKICKSHKGVGHLHQYLDPDIWEYYIDEQKI